MADTAPTAQALAAEAITESPAPAAQPRSAIERAEAALQALDAKTPPVAVEPATQEPTTPPAPKSEPTPPEEPKPERISRGLAILAQREQRVRAEEARIKSERQAHQAALAAETADLALVKSVKDALAKGGRVAALKALGIDLRTGIEELSREVEPTAEDIARRVAAEEWEIRQKAASELAEEQKRAEAEKAAAAQQVQVAEYTDRVRSSFVPAEYPHLVAHEVTDLNIWNVALQMERDTGQRPSPIEALAFAEKLLAERAEKARTALAARKKTTEAVPPAAPPKTTPPKHEERPPQRRPSGQLGAEARAAAAMRRLGIH